MQINTILEIKQRITSANILGYIKGVINLRGEIIPAIDMRSEAEKKNAEQTCIIIIKAVDIPQGILVETVMVVKDFSIVPTKDLQKHYSEESRHFDREKNLPRTEYVVIDIEEIVDSGIVINL